jgi:hypothetical protein
LLLKSIARATFEKFLHSALDRWVPRFFPYSLIDRDREPYLYRYYPHQDGDVLGFYFHKFVNGDADFEVHSHPWAWAISVILTSGYWEIRYRTFSDMVNGQQVQLHDRKECFRGPFSINVLYSSDLHRVILHDNRPVWTLFIHGPRVRTWFFVHEATGLCREIIRRTRDRLVSIRS